ncbi:MAG: beta-ketoacyl synthase N-terminal-like domain-containing protein, partial [Thiohalobacterales bacterium]
MGEVVITGLGSICGLGTTVPDYWAALMAGHSAIRPLTGVDPGIRIRVGAQLHDFQAEQYFNADELPLLDRFSQFAVISAREALADAGLENIASIVSDAAAIIGTGCGGKQTDE